MRVITGDECGLLKEVTCQVNYNDHPIKNESSTTIVNRIEDEKGCFQMSRSRGIVGICQQQQRDSFVTLRMDGTVELWCHALEDDDDDGHCKYKRTVAVRNVFSESSSVGSRPVSICSDYTQDSTAAAFKKSIVACCTNLGQLSLLDACALDKGPLTNFSVFGASVEGESNAVTAMAMDNNNNNSNNGRIAIGGRDRETRLLDVETGKTIWKAKNLPPDRQTQLQQPIWSTALQFVSQTDLLAVGTAYHQLRMYDVRVDAKQRRPILYTPLEGGVLRHRITSLCQLGGSDTRLAVGDAAGYIYCFDFSNFSSLDRNKKDDLIMTGQFNGSAGGSVRQMMSHPSLPLVTSIGLDRMLRIYNVNTRKQVDCVYLKQRLNCCLLIGEENDDNLWNIATAKQQQQHDDQEETTTVFVEETCAIDEADAVQDYIDSDNDDDDDLLDDYDDDDDDETSSSGEGVDFDNDNNNDSDNDDGLKVKNSKPTKRQKT